MIWIDKRRLARLAPALKRLYKDFAVSKRGKLGCPRSFDSLTPAWYLNCSKRPNVACDAAYDFYALRDIRPGEELTVDYSTYSEDTVPRACLKSGRSRRARRRT